VTRDKPNFLLTHNIDSNKVIGDMDFGLSRKGSLIKFYDNNFYIIDSLTYMGSDEKPDSVFTISLVHPDSNRYDKTHWNIESPTPIQKSNAFAEYLYWEEQKVIWKKRLYIGGGGFFFISLLGIMWFRYSKKRKKKLKE
jgi:hypothetical protein